MLQYYFIQSISHSQTVYHNYSTFSHMKVNPHSYIKSIDSRDQTKIAYQLQKERIKILDRKQKQYQNYIITLKQQIRMQDQQLFALDSQVNQYRSQNQLLKQELQYKKQDAEHIDEYSRLIQRLKEQKHYLNEKMLTLKHQLKEQQNKCYQLHHQNQVLKDKIQKMAKQVEQLKARIIQDKGIIKKLSTVTEINNSPSKQREILQLNFQNYQLNQEVRRYEKAIKQVQQNDKLKIKEKNQRVQQFKSKIFLIKNKIYNLKEKIEDQLQCLGIENLGYLHNIRFDQQVGINKNASLQSIIKQFDFSEPSQNPKSCLENYQQAIFNQISENQKMKKAKEQAIANILQQFQYTKKNLNVYRDKNLLQEKVIENQRQSIQELRKLIQDGEAIKEEKLQYKQNLEFIAKQLSRSSPAGPKFGLILSNLAKGRVLDIQKQIQSLKNQQKMSNQQSKVSSDYGPSNNNQKILTSNVYEWSTSKGVGQLVPKQFKLHKNSTQSEHKKSQYTHHKHLKVEQSQQINLAGTVIDALASNSTYTHNHHHLIEKKTSFDKQIVPPIDIENSYQFIKSEQILQNKSYSSENMNKQDAVEKISNDQFSVPQELNYATLDSSSINKDNNTQNFDKHQKIMPLSEQDITNSIDLE